MRSNIPSTIKRRRRRRTDEEDDEGIFSNWRLGLVIAVIVICFAMLYPTMLHPMISSIFSRSSSPQKASTRPPIHPAMSSQRSRPDIHPGMRINTGQPEIQTAPSSKATFAWLLPIYTIGVVGFLVYTLIKTKRKKRRRASYSSEESESEEGSDEDIGRERVIGKRKLKGLQERLKQTELAMKNILEQLNALSIKSKMNNRNEDKEEEELRPSDERKGRIEITDALLKDLEKTLVKFKELSEQDEEKSDSNEENSENENHSRVDYSEEDSEHIITKIKDDEVST